MAVKAPNTNEIKIGALRISPRSDRSGNEPAAFPSSSATSLTSSLVNANGSAHSWDQLPSVRLQSNANRNHLSHLREIGVRIARWQQGERRGGRHADLLH